MTAPRLALAVTACCLLFALLGSPAPAPARRSAPTTWPFAPPPGLRFASRRDALPGFYRDGRRCSVGCRAPGAARGWPVRPFHRSHLIRAGLNELRTGNLHSGIDVLARDGTRVYALEGGRAHVIERTGRDARVQVGRFQYWHIHPTIAEGQAVRPFRQVLGTVLRGASHVHVSEVLGGTFLNPLRPGGRVLFPWNDSGPPILGRPRLLPGRRVVIKAFDAQGPRRGPRSRRPALGLAGLAYRLFDSRGRRIGGLHWALRGTRRLPNSLRRRIYAPGSRPAAATCVLARRRCRPKWIYRLAGGLAPLLAVKERRVYVLSAYGWDWAGRVRRIDIRFRYVHGRPVLVRQPGATSTERSARVRRPRPVRSSLADSRMR